MDTKNGKNGIVELGDIFNLSPVEEVYNREDDILPVGKDNVDNKKEEPLKPGSEIVVEEPKKEVIIEDDPEKEIPAPVNYRPVLDALVSRGVLPDLKEVVFGGDNGEEITVDDLDFTKEESLCDVITTLFESQREESTKNKIDVDSISDFTKKLIEADKAGADVVSILKQYSTIQAPVEKLDVESPSDQIKIIRHYVDNLGLPKDEADEFYKGIIGKGEDYIEAKAIKYKAELDKQMDKLIEERTEAAARKKAKDAEDFKQYKKTLKAAFQEQYQLNDNLVAKAMDFSLKAIEGKPGVTKAYEKIREMLTDPNEAPDLIMFLMNKDEFVKQHSSKAVTEEKKKIYKLISRTSKDKRTAPVDDKGDAARGKMFDEIVLE